MDGLSISPKKIDDILLMGNSPFESLLDSNLLNILFSNHPDYIYFKNKDLKFIKINEKAAKALGLNHPDEAIGKSDFDYFPDAAEQIQSDEKRIMHNGEPQINADLKLRFADGSIHWVSATKVPFYDKNGNVAGIVGISRDITKSKVLEDSLEERTAILQLIFDSSPNCMYIKDKHGKYLIANKTIADLYKTTPKEIIGKTDADFAHQAVLKPAEAEFFVDVDKKAIETKEKQVILSEPFTWHDGTVHYFHTTKLPVNYGDDPDCVLGISVDVTTVKNKEAELQENAVKFKTLFEMVKSGVAIYDAVDDGNDFVFKEFNKSAEKIEGLKRDELIGKRVTEVFPGVKDFGIFQVFQRVWKTGKAEYFPEALYRDERDPGTWRENEVYKLRSGEIVAIYDDVTEKKKMEIALIESEEKYRTLFTHMEQGVFYQKANGELFDVNDKALEMFGLSREEFLSRTSSGADWNVIAEDGTPVPGDRHPSMIALKTGKPVYDKTVGVYNPIKDAYVWMTVNAIPQFKEGETSPYRVFLTMHDISDLKKSIEKLRISEEKYKRLVEGSPGVTYVYGTKSGAFFWSKHVQDLLGFTPDQLNEDPHLWTKSIHPDDSPQVKKILDSIKKNEKFDIEYRIKDVNGNWRWFHDRSISVEEKDGERVIEGLATDISARKSAEKNLLENENKLRLKLESVLSPDVEMSSEDFANIINSDQLQSLMDDFYKLTHIGIGILDMKGQILVATGWQDICTKFHRVHPETNKNCIESDVYLSEHVKPGEFVKYKCKNNMWDMATPIVLGGKRMGTVFLGQFFYEDEYVDRSFYEKQAEEYGFDKEAYLSALDKVPRWNKEIVNTVMTFYTKFSEMIAQLSYSNLKLAKVVEQQKKGEKELQKAHQQLQEMNKNLEDIVFERTEELSKVIKLKDEFIHQLGHDLKTPLGPLVSLLPVIKKHTNDPKDLEMLTVVQRNVSYMKNLVKKTLELAQLNSPNASFDFDLISLKELIFEVKGKNISHFVDNNVIFENNISEDIVVYADELQLFEVFDNLFNNSVKYGKEHVHITLNAEKQEHKVVVSIEDDGIGLSSEQIEHIFDEFYKVDESRHDFNSSGLGLPICKRIIEKHGGTIWVESKGQNQGSTFYFTLPLHP